MVTQLLYAVQQYHFDRPMSHNRAPSLVKAILEGRQPAELTVDALKRRSASLQLCWKQQATILEFSTQT
jgi:hypothetical protein